MIANCYGEHAPFGPAFRGFSVSAFRSLHVSFEQDIAFGPPSWQVLDSRFRACDNDAAVQLVRSGPTLDTFMQRCLRQLWLASARYDLDLHVSHIPGIHNVFADCLSRWDADSTFQRKFHELASQRNLCFHMLSIDSED